MGVQVEFWQLVDTPWQWAAQDDQPGIIIVLLFVYVATRVTNKLFDRLIIDISSVVNYT